MTPVKKLSIQACFSLGTQVLTSLSNLAIPCFSRLSATDNLSFLLMISILRINYLPTKAVNNSLDKLRKFSWSGQKKAHRLKLAIFWSTWISCREGDWITAYPLFQSRIKLHILPPSLYWLFRQTEIESLPFLMPSGPNSSTGIKCG